MGGFVVLNILTENDLADGISEEERNLEFISTFNIEMKG